MKSVNEFRREQKSEKRFRLYMLAIAVLLALYLLGKYACHLDWLTDVLATGIAIVAAVAFWLEYHESKVLNEAQFIADLNKQFLGDGNLSDVEWELEKYYNRYRSNTLTEEFCREFEEQFSIENRRRQYLVNYLVHLEGIAALVNSGVLHLSTLSDLMSYRYFVAVNNPIVQKLELLEYPDYYKGCHAIYAHWVAELQEQKTAIPLYDPETNDLAKKRDLQKKAAEK